MQPISVDSFSKNCAKYTGKYLCWSLFLMKFQALRPANLLKNDPSRGVFRCTLCSFSKNCVYKNWLLKTILRLSHLFIFFFFSKKVFKNPYFAEYLQIVASESVNIKCIFSFLTGHSLVSKGSIRYYSKRTHLDMFRSHLSLSNTKVLKKKGAFFINITMDSIRKPEAN